jgi:predicted amidohydrolase YtcJ
MSVVRWIWLAAFGGVALGLGCASAPERPAPSGPATTLYTAKRIRTMDPARPVATAVAVRDGRIVGVGDVETLADDLGPDANLRVDDRFANQVLLPGLVENHLHPMMAALLLPMEFATPYDWNLPGRQAKGVRGRAAYIARMRELEQAHPVAAPLFVWGYHAQFHGALSRSDLNEISTHRPIIAWHRSFHEIIVNDAALELMGIEEKDVAGHHHIDWSRGHFFETGLFVAMEKLKPTLLAPDWIGRGLDLTKRAIHLGGVTTVADMAFGLYDLEVEIAAMGQAIGGDDTPFRTLLVPNARSLSLVLGNEAAFDVIEKLPAHNTDRLRFVRQVKLFADGAFYSQLMQMSEGYLDGHHGEWLMTPEELLATAGPYWDAGYQLHVHVNGDLGVKSALDTLETLPRIARLGAGVSANPYYLYALGNAYSREGLGPERASHMVRLGSLARADVPISLHSDFTMAPVEPLRLAWVAANRITAEGNVLGPEERIDVEHALRAVTIDAAWAIQMEDEIGSIEVGKRADFTVLERDPIEAPPEALADTPIWGTVFEGQVFPLE